MVILLKIENRKARYEYFIESEFEAGIVLVGTEVKSIRNGSANISEAFCRVKNNEVFINNMYIDHYDFGNQFNHDERRERKLLLNKHEIKKISDKIKLSGLTLIPLSVYFVNSKAKVKIGLAKGKKNYDKRNSIKERDISRNLAKELKGKY